MPTALIVDLTAAAVDPFGDCLSHSDVGGRPRLDAAQQPNRGRAAARVVNLIKELGRENRPRFWPQFRFFLIGPPTTPQAR